MSYGASAGLQAAVYQHLANDTELGSLVGGAIFDEPLQGSPHIDEAYVTIGEEIVRPFNSKTSAGAFHDFEVTVHSGQCGFDGAKRIAEAICRSLTAATLELALGTLVDIRFLRAKAQRGRSPVRRTIELRFRAVIDGI
jgi:Protein of unknown function (DUF3168)